MKAIIQKVSAQNKDAKKSVQLRIEQDQVESKLLNIIKGDKIVIYVEDSQSSINQETGELENSKIEIPTDTISISIAVLEDGQIWTVTATFSGDQFVELVEKGLVGKICLVEFK